MSYHEEFGAMVRSYREKKHYSREKLAEICGISDRCISNIERGVSDPKFDTAIKLCSACDIDTGLLNSLENDDVHSDDSLLLTR